MKREEHRADAVSPAESGSGLTAWQLPFTEEELRSARSWRERLREAEEKYRDALRDAESDPDRRKAILETISGEVGPVPDLFNMTAATMTPLIAALVRIDEEKKKEAAWPAVLRSREKQVPAVRWTCPCCGRENGGRHCTGCGKKRP